VKYILLVLTLLSCGSAGTPQSRVNPEIREYYWRFERICKCTVSHIPAKFVEQENDTVGGCYRSPAVKYIVIDPEWWRRSSDSEREHLVFHELGHCYLLREHRNGYMYTSQGDHVPRSIMNEHMFRTKYIYRKYREYYIRELVR
jgi:hypothetical protein